MILFVIVGTSVAVVVFVAFSIFILDKKIRCPECGARMKELFGDIPENEKKEGDEGHCYLIKTCPNGHVVKEKVSYPSGYPLARFGGNFFSGI